MTPAKLRRWVAILFLAASCGTAFAAAPPNVLFILPDQYRPDIIGAYGGTDITTPNLDRLAREGMVFTNALSTTPLCTPYRGMLMTGRYPTHSGLVMNFLQASAEQNPHPLAGVFAAAGYRTGFIGKWHLDSGFLGELGSLPKDSPIATDLMEAARKPATPGIGSEQAALYRRAYQQLRAAYPNSEFVPPGPLRLGFEEWAAYNFHTTFNDFWYYADQPQKIETRRYETDVEVDLAIDFMKRRQDCERPFFLVVAPHPPHPPLTAASAPAGYLEKIPAELTWAPNVPADHPRRKDPLQVRSYLAMAKNVDDNVGRLLRFLDESGLAGNTIVVFSTDHGEMHGSHGRTDKMVPYREAVSIPLIMRWPSKIPAGARTDELQTPMDHLPTLARLAGIQPPESVDGLDLSAVVLKNGKVERDAVLMASYTSHWDFFQTQTAWPEWRGVQTKRFTYARWLSGEEELYDNREDPYQLRNLAADPRARQKLDRLRRELARLLEEAHDAFLPGNAYAGWYDDGRRLIETGLGPVRGVAAGPQPAAGCP